tara:strand:- start:183 stop:551 length:369 start_codon:yes stop_codon:yes gene_type:complete
VIFFILLFFIAIFYVIRFFLEKDKSPTARTSRFLIRFKSRFKNRDRLRAKLSEDFSNSLMLDPEYNITISSWYTESELREKADIHRARLSKYGRSKMNGEMLFLGPKGGVYKYNSDGKKKYL